VSDEFLSFESRLFVSGRLVHVDGLDEVGGEEGGLDVDLPKLEVLVCGDGEERPEGGHFGDGGVGLGKVDAFSLRVPFGDPSCLELADGSLFVSFDRVDPSTSDWLPRLGELRELEDAVCLKRRHLFVHRGLPVLGVLARERFMERLWDGDRFSQAVLSYFSFERNLTVVWLREGDLQVEAERQFWSLEDDVWKLDDDVGIYRCLSTTKGK
jgi:hypothetical protein